MHVAGLHLPCNPTYPPLHETQCQAVKKWYDPSCCCGRITCIVWMASTGNTHCICINTADGVFNLCTQQQCNPLPPAGGYPLTQAIPQPTACTPSGIPGPPLTPWIRPKQRPHHHHRGTTTTQASSTCKCPGSQGVLWGCRVCTVLFVHKHACTPMSHTGCSGRTARIRRLHSTTPLVTQGPHNDHGPPQLVPCSTTHPGCGGSHRV